MKLERRTEETNDRDLDQESPVPAKPEPTVLMDAPEDPFRGLSDGEVLQRLELI
jgi:hypothetical protein